ncbi:DUF1801 domain-containing protein [Pseudoxanthomonas putridarboris]|uniref:DUF1801 domain-containing protein n=1 Tax=Pseudoxanthomonas putridarboris TaxID=752605 RepID=A0ABU9J399_9GAMM
MEKTSDAKEAAEASPFRLIDARIKELADWRGGTLARVRTLIQHADPEVVEERKWRGVPVWSHAGIICTDETYKAAVKLTLANGHRAGGPFRPLQCQPGRQYLSRHRYPEGDKIDGAALKALIRAAVALDGHVEEEGKERLRRTCVPTPARIRRAGVHTPWDLDQETPCRPRITCRRSR